MASSLQQTLNSHGFPAHLYSPAAAAAASMMMNAANGAAAAAAAAAVVVGSGVGGPGDLYSIADYSTSGCLAMPSSVVSATTEAAAVGAGDSEGLVDGMSLSGLATNSLPSSTPGLRSPSASGTNTSRGLTIGLASSSSSTASPSPSSTGQHITLATTQAIRHPTGPEELASGTALRCGGASPTSLLTGGSESRPLNFSGASNSQISLSANMFNNGNDRNSKGSGESGCPPSAMATLTSHSLQAAAAMAAYHHHQHQQQQSQHQFSFSGFSGAHRSQDTCSPVREAGGRNGGGGGEVAGGSGLPSLVAEASEQRCLSPSSMAAAAIMMTGHMHSIQSHPLYAHVQTQPNHQHPLQQQNGPHHAHPGAFGDQHRGSHRHTRHQHHNQAKEQQLEAQPPVGRSGTARQIEQNIQQSEAMPPPIDMIHHQDTQQAHASMHHSQLSLRSQHQLISMADSSPTSTA
ncbi:unnamed protein product [Protopolystoma xenopodis]|uniref:Uncharacterized protein n=1 Tax=Protopolystoma xenopodis TaxID=117903 RepID=A0A448WDN7_9PLAT|nr:unnamed protein product [Protopolystoma xenopodis]